MGCFHCKADKTEADLDDLDKLGADRGRAASAVNDEIEANSSSIKMTTCVTCEKLGVTARDLYRLRQSWKGIKRKMEETGIEMFVRLFKQSAELKQMFSKFKHLESEDDLRTNEALEHHATLVMMTIDDAITHIDNYDYVIDALQKAAISHLRFIGFKPDNFWKVHDPFLEAVKVTLGDRLTENMEAIYKVALTFILQTMVDGLNLSGSTHRVPIEGRSVDTVAQTS